MRFKVEWKRDMMTLEKKVEATDVLEREELAIGSIKRLTLQ
jgi:predicted RNA-binding protein